MFRFRMLAVGLALILSTSVQSWGDSWGATSGPAVASTNFTVLLSAAKSLHAITDAKMTSEANAVAVSIESASSSATTCSTAKSAAVAGCDETVNPILTEAAKVSTEYGNMATMVGNSFGACSAIAQGTSKVNTLLQTYSFACKAVQVTCKSTCASASTALTAVTAKMNALVASAHAYVVGLMPACSVLTPYNAECNAQYLSAQAAETSIAALQTPINNSVSAELSAAGNPLVASSVGLNNTYCTVFASKSLVQAGMQATVGLLLASQSGNCAAATGGVADSSEAFCTSNPSAAQCNCSLANQTNTQRCICQRDPRTTGCQNNLAKGGGANSDVAMKVGGTTGTSNSVPVPPGNTIPMPTQDQLQQQKVGGGGQTPTTGDRGGGGGGGVGGGGGSGNQMDKATPTVASKGNSSNLGGWGGGGGGGSFGNGNGGVDPNDPLAKYLPNDPSRKPAALAEVRKQVTAGVGKTNWEKVKYIYFDKSATLIGN